MLLLLLLLLLLLVLVMEHLLEWEVLHGSHGGRYSRGHVRDAAVMAVVSAAHMAHAAGHGVGRRGGLLAANREAENGNLSNPKRIFYRLSLLSFLDLLCPILLHLSLNNKKKSY